MTFAEYKKNFINSHKGDWTVTTSPMDEYGQYVKTYAFESGATMTEINRPVWETVETEVEVKGIKVKVKETVKLLETECWTTDDAKSVKFYELF